MAVHIRQIFGLNKKKNNLDKLSIYYLQEEVVKGVGHTKVFGWWLRDCSRNGGAGKVAAIRSVTFTITSGRCKTRNFTVTRTRGFDPSYWQVSRTCIISSLGE